MEQVHKLFEISLTAGFHHGHQNEKAPPKEALLNSMVGAVGLEPTSLAAADFKSAASANSATPPRKGTIVSQK